MFLLFLSSLCLAGDWSSWRGDSAMSGNAGEAIKLPLEQKWQYLSEYEFTGTPVGGGGKIFLLTREGWVVCLSTGGKELWKQRFLRKTDSGSVTNVVFSGPAAFSSNTLVACTEKGSVFGISTADGAQQWLYETGGALEGAPVIDDSGVIILTKTEGRVHCIDLEKGVKVWISDVDARADGNPAVCSGLVVYGNCNAKLNFLDRATGKTSGIVEFGEGHEIAGTPACADGKVYVGTRAGYLMCVDVLKKKLLWKKDVGGGELFAPPAVLENSVLISKGDISILSFAGRLAGWEYKSESTLTAPVVAGKNVVLVSGSMLVTLNGEDGSLTGTVKCGSSDFPPAIIEGMVIVAGDDSSVYCFGAE